MLHFLVSGGTSKLENLISATFLDKIIGHLNVPRQNKQALVLQYDEGRATGERTPPFPIFWRAFLKWFGALMDERASSRRCDNDTNPHTRAATATEKNRIKPQGITHR
jgi:hypothetical protein